MEQSVRAQIIERRTYLRPLDADGTKFETATESWERVIRHQRWLWERAKGEPLNEAEESELTELLDLFLERKVTVSGRTRWLGGTEIAKEREASQFNCSYLTVRTIHDIVDSLWMLLQGCGVGFTPEVGILNGFSTRIKDVEIIRSTKVLPTGPDGKPISDPALKGHPDNVETFNPVTREWRIVVGDSAAAWAKFAGKLFAFKRSAAKLVVDFSQIRPAGYRLSGYGWISSGDEQIAVAVTQIVRILNERSGQLLTAIDILDVMNVLGTILSSRRSAEIALYPFEGPEWKDFATAKANHFDNPNTKHRSMSNNSLVFNKKPTRIELKKIFELIVESGGSEPGFLNAQAARKRAPYYKGVNPCCEILLGDMSTCNLVETILPRFNGNMKKLLRAHYLVARANYRQTCVDFRDGVLQHSWHELAEFLRLCGVGVTGVVAWQDAKNPESWRRLRDAAWNGADDMADDLDLPRSKLITTCKPSGTQSKVSGLEGDEIPEGVHKPLGRYIFNNVNFSKHDPLVAILRDANYRVFPNPYDDSAVVVTFPVEYSNIKFDEVRRDVDGEARRVHINLESAITQLERYRMLQENYIDHNCSITISYSPDEVPDIIDWLQKHWDIYVGVSFVFRNDPRLTAADLGYPYLPQEVVDGQTFTAYKSTLNPVTLNDDGGDLIDVEDCSTGACPIR